MRAPCLWKLQACRGFQSSCSCRPPRGHSFDAHRIALAGAERTGKPADVAKGALAAGLLAVALQAAPAHAEFRLPPIDRGARTARAARA